MTDPNHWVKIIHPDDRERVLEGDRRTNETGEPFRAEYRQFTRDGRAVWLRDEASLVRDREGKALYWLGVQLDITERKEAEEALRKSEAGLAATQRLAHLGGWEWDIKTDEIYWSDEVYRIYGFAPQGIVPSLEMLMEVVHPNDRGLIEGAIDNALNGYEPYDLEHRIIRTDGEVGWVHRRAEVFRDEAGEPLRMVGTCRTYLVSHKREAQNETSSARRQKVTLMKGDEVPSRG
jgi:PAS domain S-box-containing protein